jgi:hypothetical protein
MDSQETNSLRVMLRAAEASGLWIFLSANGGFDRDHMPNDAELLRLARIAAAEGAPWSIRAYLQAALRIAA